MNRLWFRSFAATAIVVIVALFFFGVFSQREIHLTVAREAAGGRPPLPEIATRLRAEPHRWQAVLEDASKTVRDELFVTQAGTVVASAPIDANGGLVGRSGNALVIVDRRNAKREMRVLDPPAAELGGGATLYAGPALPEGPPLERRIYLGLAATAIIVLAVTLALTRSIVAPIERLTDAAKRVATGDYAHAVPPDGGAEFAQLAEAFNTMAGALERDRRLRETLVRDLAHEIRTPLTNITCQLEAMQDGLIPVDRAAVDALRADIAALERLIDGVQELALTRVAPAGLRRAPVAIEEIVQPPVRAVQAQALAKNVALDVRVEPGLPAIEADRDRVRGVVANLVANALRHTPSGGAIAIEARRAGSAVAVAVRDDGEGIAPADLPAIFERTFTRGGSGLGLAIARDVIEAHGGTIGATSTLGAGTTVTFTLPIGVLATS